jgi:hypothetical protein
VRSGSNIGSAPLLAESISSSTSPRAGTITVGTDAVQVIQKGPTSPQIFPMCRPPILTTRTSRSLGT